MAVPSRTRLPDQHIKPAGNKKSAAIYTATPLTWIFFIMPVIFFALVLIANKKALHYGKTFLLYIALYLIIWYTIFTVRAVTSPPFLLLL